MEIKKGDLVMVVKPSECCGSDASVGKIFKVVGINNYLGKCISCRKERKIHAAYKTASVGCALTRLKKIKPIDELEREEKSVEVMA